MEGLPHWHQEQDRRRAPASHRQPPESPITSTGSRSGSSTSARSRSPSGTSSAGPQGGQTTCSQFPYFTFFYLILLLITNWIACCQTTNLTLSFLQVPNRHSLCRWSTHGSGALPKVYQSTSRRASLGSRFRH